jgi:hypothetical protein
MNWSSLLNQIEIPKETKSNEIHSKNEKEIHVKRNLKSQIEIELYDKFTQLLQSDPQLFLSVKSSIEEKNKNSESGRFIEYFLASYCKNVPVKYVIQNNKEISFNILTEKQHINLHNFYMYMMKKYTKKNFDIFNRGKFVMLKSKTNVQNVSLCQMNFYLWAHETCLFKVIEKLKQDCLIYKQTGTSNIQTKYVKKDNVFIKVLQL